jgi:hypothetical protein
MVKLEQVFNKAFGYKGIGRLQKDLEDLLSEVSRNRKFWAKLQRIAAEFGSTPAKVITEGVEDWRDKQRLLNGPMAKRLNDPQKLLEYSRMQSLAGQLTAEALGEEGVKKRALAGAEARKASLQKKKKVAARKTSRPEHAE